MSSVADIQALLDLFEDKVPDKASNRLVKKFASDKAKWYEAHGLFTTIRERNLKAIKEGNKKKECQYCFEEVCAKTLYNITGSSAPFDADSPYWVIKNALSLATALGMSTEEIVNIVAPNKSLNQIGANDAPPG